MPEFMHLSSDKVFCGTYMGRFLLKVSEYVKERILALQREQPGKFLNVACARTNAMKFLPNYFHKGQLEKLFFLFPDPHFKATNHRYYYTIFGLHALCCRIFEFMKMTVADHQLSVLQTFVYAMAGGG